MVTFAADDDDKSILQFLFFLFLFLRKESGGAFVEIKLSSLTKINI
jgi:hypothetical protein